MFSEIYDEINTAVVLAGTVDQTLENTLNSAPTGDKLSKGLVYVSQALDLYFGSETADGNWLIETNFATDRAQILTIEEVYGNIELGTISVSNHIGMNNDHVNDL